MDTNKIFSIGDIIEAAWTKQKERLLYYAWVFAVYQAIAYFLGFFADKAKPHLLTYFSFQFAMAIILTIMQIGIIRFFIRSVDGEKPEMGDIFESGDYFWRYLGSMVLVGIPVAAVAVIGAGLVTFIVAVHSSPLIILPVVLLLALIAVVIYFGSRLILLPYFIVDQNAGPITAVKESWKISTGLEWRIVLFMLVLGGINIVGAIFFGLGLLISLPLTQLSTALLYRQLQSAGQQLELPATEVNEPLVKV